LSLDSAFYAEPGSAGASLVLAFRVLRGACCWAGSPTRFAKKYVMVLIYLLVAGAIPLLFAGQSEAASMRSGFGFRDRAGRRLHDCSADDGGDFGIQRLGLLLGVILTANGVAEAASPWLVGHMRDATGMLCGRFFAVDWDGIAGCCRRAVLPKGRKPT